MSNIEEVISIEEIDERVQELAERINEDYQNEEIIFVTVLGGAFIFAADLVRAVDLPVHCEFLKVSSYHGGKVSSGNVKMSLDIDPKKVEGKNIILVEDIVDTGNTIVFLKEHFQKMSPKSLKVCSLLLKKEALQHEIDVEYVGFSIPSLFVIGYGLDYDEYYRDLPYVGVLLEDGENFEKDAQLIEKGN